MADYYPTPASTGFSDEKSPYLTVPEVEGPHPANDPPNDNAGVWEGHDDPTGH